MVSLILPVFNDIKNGYLPKIVDSLNGIGRMEKIAVDGGSADDTADYLRDNGFGVHSLPQSSRAARLKKGLELSTGKTVLFHHPRSVLEPEALQWLVHEYSGGFWGGFTHQFDVDHWLLRFTSWYSNKVRARTGILYLDHCIFFPREAIPEPGVIPDVEIFEDTEISRILMKKLGLPRVMPQGSKTSAVRFQKNGIYRQAILNQKMKIQYHMGNSHKKMNDDYESDLRLNN